MNRHTRAIPVNVLLAPQLYGVTQPKAQLVEEQTYREVIALLGELGVPGQPAVDLSPAPCGGTARPVAVLVRDRECRFPPDIMADAAAYVLGTPCVSPDTLVMKAIRDVARDAETTAEFVSLVVRAAVAENAGTLISVSEGAAAHTLVSLGMSIGAAGDALATDNSDVETLEAAIAAAASDSIDVHIHPAYLKELTTEPAAQEAFGSLREAIFRECGLPLPALRFRPDRDLRPEAFAFRINAVRGLPRIGLAPGSVLVNAPPQELASLGVKGEAALHPSTGADAAIIAVEDKVEVERAGFRAWEPVEFLVACLGTAVRRNAHALMTQDVAATLVERLAYAFPALGELMKQHGGATALAPLLRDLLLDGIGSCNLRRVTELMLRYDTAGERDDQQKCGDFVRGGMAEFIGHRLALGTGKLSVYAFDQKIEAAVGDALDESLTSEPADCLSERLGAALRAALARTPPTPESRPLLTRTEMRAEQSHTPPQARGPIILASADLRRPVRELLRHQFRQLSVISSSEVPSELELRPMVRVAWDCAPDEPRVGEARDEMTH